MKNFLISFLIFPILLSGQNLKINDYKVTILSTMLSDFYIGEWGFCALIELDGKKILFDTGSRENTVLNNAKELNIDLNGIENVYLSHNHKDHTGGLMNLKKNFPNSFSVAHVGEGIFYSRPSNKGDKNYILSNKLKITDLGVNFFTHKNATQIFTGVWTTGQVPRKYDEKNWSRLGKIVNSSGEIEEDIIPEDQSLFFDTEGGIVMISGCGHAGIVNTIQHIKKIIPNRPIHKVIGGFHLLKLNDKKLEWTAKKMLESGVKVFVGAHCTGINSTYSIREYMGLDSKSAIVGSVGTVINKEGVFPGYME